MLSPQNSEIKWQHQHELRDHSDHCICSAVLQAHVPPLPFAMLAAVKGTSLLAKLLQASNSTIATASLSTLSPNTFMYRSGSAPIAWKMASTVTCQQQGRRSSMRMC